MKAQSNLFIRHLNVKLLVICLAAIAPIDLNGIQAPFLQLAFSQPSIPSGWESHLDRPDILKLSPARADGLGKDWDSLKAAHFSFVAELLELYPKDTHIYFLARDSENLYDVARMVTEGTAEFQRIHLLNISRANVSDPNLMAYLKENGISEESLTTGKKVVFVDTGYRATIPGVIAGQLSFQARAQIKTHLIVSTNPAHPASRTFLVHLDPSVNEASPQKMERALVTYEQSMVRYMHKSSKYVYADGRFHPISPINYNPTGPRQEPDLVSKEQSLKFMKDLKFEWQKPETKARLRAERTQFFEIKQALTEGSESAKFDLKTEFERLKGNPSAQRLFEAQIRDIIQSKTNAGLQINLRLEDIGLNTILDGNNSDKNALIKKYPEWAPIFESPNEKIRELFEQQKWQTISDLLNVKLDFETDRLLMNRLYSLPATPVQKDLQIRVIKYGAPEILQKLVKQFSYVNYEEEKEFLKLLIQKGDNSILRALAFHVFSKSHPIDTKDLLKLVIEKGDVIVLMVLAEETFSRSHAKSMKDLLRLVIEKSDAHVLRTLAHRVFSEAHTQEMTDLLKLVVERGDAMTLSILERRVFSQQHAKTPEHAVLKHSLKIADSKERRSFIEVELQKIDSPLATGRKFIISTKPLPESGALSCKALF